MRKGRLTGQLPPFKATPDQERLVREKADREGLNVSEVQRAAIDAYFGLVNGVEQPEGE